MAGKQSPIFRELNYSSAASTQALPTRSTAIQLWATAAFKRVHRFPGVALAEPVERAEGEAREQRKAFNNWFPAENDPAPVSQIVDRQMPRG